MLYPYGNYGAQPQFYLPVYTKPQKIKDCLTGMSKEIKKSLQKLVGLIATSSQSVQSV
jgi:hypothetical protein